MDRKADEEPIVELSATTATPRAGGWYAAAGRPVTPSQPTAARRFQERAA